MSASSISAKGRYSLFLTADGSVWGCGDDQNGQIGLGDYKTVAVPTMNPHLPTICEIYTPRTRFDSFSLFIDENGQVWGTGSNSKGQLGVGHTSSTSTPVVMTNIPPIISAACGSDYCMLVDKNGDVWGCGNNSSGQMGAGDHTSFVYPRKIPNIPPVKSVACASESSILLTEAGEVYIIDPLSNLRLEQKGKKPKIIPNLPRIEQVSLTDYHCCFLDENGGTWGVGGSAACQLGFGDIKHRAIPERIPNLPSIKFVSTSSVHSLLVSSNGEVLAAGNNLNYVLGLDTFSSGFHEVIPDIPPMRSVCAGTSHSTFEDENGGAWACGSNTYSQLGIPEIDECQKPQKIGGLPPLWNQRRFAKTKACC